MKVTQIELVQEYFTKHPRQNLKHPEVVDWLTREFFKRTGKVFRDPDRAIRTLHQRGFLIKIAKGIYRYDPDQQQNKVLTAFTLKQKKMIKQRDRYRCVICGLGPRNGVEIHIDHIKPRALGGKSSVANGQVLCAKHNFFKKTLNQTSVGKRMFVNLLSIATKSENVDLVNFCQDILKVYEKYQINGDIQWMQSNLKNKKL